MSVAKQFLKFCVKTKFIARNESGSQLFAQSRKQDNLLSATCIKVEIGGKSSLLINPTLRLEVSDLAVRVVFCVGLVKPTGLKISTASLLKEQLLCFGVQFCMGSQVCKSSIFIILLCTIIIHFDYLKLCT